MVSEKTRIIGVISGKGGVGKTTMAFNLAHALSHQGSKVLCIDMDPQSNLSLLFGIDSKDIVYSVYHLLLNNVKELKPLHTSVVFTDVVKEVNGIDLLPASQDLSGFELSVAGISGARQLILKQFIDRNLLRERYDYIIIDGPPTLGLLVVNILCASDGVLVPFQPDQFSRKGLAHFHEVVENIKDMGVVHTPKILGYIPNLVDTRRKQVGEDFELIKQDLSSGKIFESLGNRVQLVKSSANKKSVYDYKGSEYQELQNQFNSIAQHIGQELQ